MATTTPGVHFKILFKDNVKAFKVSNFSKHCREYSEHVGEYLHRAGKIGEIIL